MFPVVPFKSFCLPIDAFVTRAVNVRSMAWWTPSPKAAAILLILDLQTRVSIRNHLWACDCVSHKGVLRAVKAAGCHLYLIRGNHSSSDGSFVSQPYRVIGQAREHSSDLWSDSGNFGFTEKFTTMSHTASDEIIDYTTTCRIDTGIFAFIFIGTKPAVSNN